MLSEEIYYYKIKFTDIYQHVVLPALRIVENDRKKWQESAFQFKQGTVVFVTVMFIFVNLYISSRLSPREIAAPSWIDNVIIMWTTPEVLLFLVLASIVGGILCYSLSLICKTKFEETLKSKIVPIAVKAYDTLKWSTAPIIPVGEIVASKIFDSKKLAIESISNGDTFIGSFKNHTFKMSEIMLNYKKGEGSKNFRGIMISVEIPRRILGNTIVKNVDTNTAYEYGEISLFDEFSKYFKVFTTDKLEGRYLVSDAFLQTLQNLKKAFSADNVECSFFEHRLLITLETTSPLFFVGDFDNSVLDTNRYTLFLDRLVLVFEIIEALKIY